MENYSKHPGRLLRRQGYLKPLNRCHGLEFRAFRFMEDLKICLIEIPVIFVYRKM